MVVSRSNKASCANKEVIEMTYKVLCLVLLFLGVVGQYLTVQRVFVFAWYSLSF